ncbi:undecaprenyldiphospho-muramoylpentapeptide beta-N-acetylglucosaminyltransferase [Rhizobiaceae bacterium BDR2-2]|uniref:UDP-N-acetylglucosamine--N-acetylmuramyl-(pentapeptide) pyrophosphoryl-undecaprenol N-acetylglucosamine transferase n=1 Tax=Ectorhizobium quercum TaxID=2965071 RepID=A0AAE3MZC1_9HYPH|nr:undecaprenyldiphospho-muramoylpentapeptide beta-N-acetylglucosaminyltransferase [Ectorhizobium quercum]MCX8996465.1 undecaprenyldiphospho-muramoylpentapeptide beta-N-acetylglucosaminyltransferase [Ectorhizobium quercum]
MTDRLIFLAAGGTGGHLFPAEALAHELKARGYGVHLVTDSRAARYAGKFPADEIHVVPSATISSKNPIVVAKAALMLWRGLIAARRILRSHRPAAIVGFGGYPTVPPLMSAVRFGIPSVVHEQNAVMGRANKALAPRVQAIAGGFLKPSGAFAGKIVEVGNPVRPSVIEAATVPFTPPQEEGELRLTVFGGSQGARFFSDMVPEAVARLPEALRKRLHIVQQARAEDEARVKARYGELGVEAEIASFFSDLPGRVAQSHLVIGRAGASTVLELTVIGRPSILVPLPIALDDDQGHNAQILVDVGAAEMRRQNTIDPDNLAAEIASLLSDPARLAAMAAAARTLSRTDAQTRLADLVVAIAEGETVEHFKTHCNNKGARP